MSMKQVIVMRKDLGMRKGKMIAQGAHASMAFLTNALADADYSVEFRSETIQFDHVLVPAEAFQWITSNFKKVVVYVNSEDELLEIFENARNARLKVHLIEDSGLTEFDGQKTLTCLAIGPDKPSRIDPVTGHLPLL